MGCKPVLSTSSRRRLLTGASVTIVVLALVVSMVSLALAVSSFPDVPPAHPYYAAITDLADRGIINGYTNGNFGPGDPVTRQQFAKMVVLTGAYPVDEGDVCFFTDVDKSDASTLYPDNYVAVAAQHGITVGKTPTSFDPYANITRYQVITMVVRAADNLKPGLLTSPPSGFTPTGTWGTDPTHGANAARAEYNGLLLGLNLAVLNPLGNMTRGEVAQVLNNLLGKLTPTSTTTTTTGSSTTTTGGGTTSSTTTTTSSTTTSSSSTTTTTNHPPVASAGADQMVSSGAGVTLTGSGTDADGDPLTYQWTQTGGPTVSLAGAASAIAAFLAPTGPATLTFSLVVNDGQVQSAADSVTVTVEAPAVHYESLGGVITSRPAVCSWAPGRLDVFVRGGDGALYHKFFEGGIWWEWENLGGFIQAGSDPAVASWGYGRIDVFVRGSDNYMYHKYYDGGWSDYERVVGFLTASPAVCSQRRGRLDVFYKLSAVGVYQSWWEGGGWVDGSYLGGFIKSGSSPTAVSWDNNRIDVFYRNADTDELRHITWNGSAWSAESLGKIFTSGVGAASWGPGRIDLFMRGAGDVLQWGVRSGGWSGWTSLGGAAIGSDPAAVSWGPDRIDVFVRGTDGALWHRFWDGVNWAP